MRAEGSMLFTRSLVKLRAGGLDAASGKALLGIW